MIVLIGTIVFISNYLLDFLGEFFWGLQYKYWMLIIYGILLIVFQIIVEIFPNKIFDYINLVLLSPLALLFTIVMVSKPFLALLIHLIYYLFIPTIIPFGFYFANEYYSFIPINTETYVYLIITFSVIIATSLNNQIKYIVYLASPIKILKSDDSEKFRFKELTDYLLSKTNIRFIIYLSYFIYLITFNIFNLQNITIYETEVIDRAVLQSFITFVAFDSVLRNLKPLDFKSSEMLKRIVRSITGKDLNV
ncbi:hypothetical protein G3567_08425 [Psychroflexus sp. YR1-1]|uniref:Uncharacterized protein n=1 Tax=Psychroflexus aurantiacus TaxID=2709310 RepID=A0A6B3R291_9FLAO|nr:hypothetical protein [Psychroflexus aurantiacus]NEV94168.1 hypothetical protein [Psychroflexus aurantiacus]